MSIINNTQKTILRDDVTHKCDVYIATRLIINRDNYKYNKNIFETDLFKHKFISEKLPRYSKHSNSFSILITHIVRDYELNGFKMNCGNSYAFHGVVKNLNIEFKNCILQNNESKSWSEYNNTFDIRNDKEDFVRCLKNYETFNELLGYEDNLSCDLKDSERIEYFLSIANSIEQQVFFLEAKSAEHLNKGIRSQRMICSSDNDYDLIYMNKRSYDRSKGFIDRDKFEEKFKLKEHLYKLEQKYLSSKDFKIKLNLNKDFEVNLTATSDETKEDLLHRAKSEIISHLNTGYSNYNHYDQDSFSVLSESEVA